MTLTRNTGSIFFFFQAEDGIRDLVRSRGLGDVYKRQAQHNEVEMFRETLEGGEVDPFSGTKITTEAQKKCCLLYTSDAADERSSVDLGGRRIIKKKKK